MNFLSLDQADVNGKVVLLRADLNVPVQDGNITDYTRIDRVKPTIDSLVKAGAKILLCCHYGRPKGEIKPEFSVGFMQDALNARWGTKVYFSADCIGTPVRDALNSCQSGEVVLLENVRFHKGEEKNDPAFAQQLCEHADLYVNDAFSAAHRAHASTTGVAALIPAYAGRLMEEELNALGKALETPERPLMAIVGGAKISTKLELLNNLVQRVDFLVLGGGMANTFLYAQGHELGSSLCEKDMKDTALKIMDTAKQSNCSLILPVDGVAAQEFKAQASSKTFSSNEDVPEGYMILDMGSESVEKVTEHLSHVKTVVWNGPVGAFELEPFDKATNSLALQVAELTKAGKLISVAGGGDTVAALEKSGAAKDFSYISTAGGAFLEWLEGKTLPGVLALEGSFKSSNAA